MQTMPFLTRAVRYLPDGMGGDIQYYNNIYGLQGAVIGRTDDGMYAIYDWVALEVDPRTGLDSIYNQDTLALIGPTTGEPLGLIDDSIGYYSGIITKVSLVVETSPGSEVTP
jgi:hypothetical protein